MNSYRKIELNYQKFVVTLTSFESDQIMYF